MAFNPRALELLGLLDFDDRGLTRPSTAPSSCEQRGHWKVEHFEEVSVWSCLCGRSDSFVVPKSHLRRIRLPNDLIKACEVCRHEYDTASGHSGALIAFLERHRPLINEHHCLEYTENRTYLFSQDDGKSARTKRVIYEAFYKKRLSTEQCVTSLCTNPLCINPYHLCVKSSPRQKTTPEVRQAILALRELGVSPETTKGILETKFGIQLCVSTIRRVKAEPLQSVGMLS